VEVTIDGAVQAQPLELVQGQSKTVSIKVFGSDNTTVLTGMTTALKPAKAGVVQVDPDPQGHKLTALAVQNQDSTAVKVEVDGRERPETFTVRVLEAVASVEAAGGNAISIAEGDTFALKFNVKGQQGTALSAVGLPFRSPDVSPSLQPLVRLDRDPVSGGYTITALPLPPGSPNPTTGTITFTAERGFNNQAVTQPPVTVSIRQKFGYITFEPPPRGVLLPGGTFTTLAVVRRKDGTPQGNYGVEYSLANSAHSKWITLAPEGNKINIYWNDPSPSELATLPDGTKETRPAQVIVRAVARSAIRGEEITGEIFVRMASVSKFAPIRVKLNLMDAVTASDLYGKVLSDEYYVLTVRLFNNLRDDTTRESTGDSILAYSSSIEVAVGIEKKFDAETGSEFPNVIGKGAARDLARTRRDAAIALANRQAQTEIAAANEAQDRLEAAIRNERQSRKDAAAAREKALNLRDMVFVVASEVQRLRRNPRTSRRDLNAAQNRYEEALAAAREATYEANIKSRVAQDAAGETNGVRASILREATNRVTVSQNITANSDPDTAIDDGKWRPVNPSDFNRISEPKLPDDLSLPELPDVPDPLGNIGAQAAPAAARDAEPTPVDETAEGEEEEDPPCRGTITYRPFTFEMMVNTVDRRDGRSRRSRIFTLLEALGTGTSFITSVAVPGNSSDLPLGLEKYRNLLIPGIERLYPSSKEQHRQNIVSQAMKEIEEIPFGSDITRVIFIPRKTIRGLVRGHEARISEVCPFYFKIQVAIINKRSTVTQGEVTR
jgi:hypothetical protein